MLTSTKTLEKSTALFAHYQQQCQAGAILADAEQLRALNNLQLIYDDLVHAARQPRFGWLLRRKIPVKGAYLYGGVGIGKTFLMDCFFECLPFKEKMRLHFHAFMQEIHDALKRYQHVKNPLTLIAREIAVNYRVLCFDEFIVTDIVDAMLLAGLLKALFDEGICLVTTSNTAPHDLYKDGLQRTSFLPAIHLLQKHTDVIYLATINDYREHIATKHGVIHQLHDPLIDDQMEQKFLSCVKQESVQFDPIYINNRWINVRKSTHEAVWFDFHEICASPRNQHDYLALVSRYRYIFVSNIPKIARHEKNKITLFMRFIDIIYDANISFIFSTMISLAHLFDATGYPAGYERTCSRLKEMSVALKNEYRDF